MQIGKLTSATLASWVEDEVAEFAKNFDLTNIVTPVNAQVLSDLLRESGYDRDETHFLYTGFTNGFDICYDRPKECCSTSSNIPLKIGSKTQPWNKLIKEVRLKRVVGPFDSIPFANYIQSPIGLVPKAGNTNKTRLIFHLSYDFNKNEKDKSLNYHTPNHLCSVKYNDLDHAIKNCLAARQEGERSGVKFHEAMEESGIFLSKTDIESAFCLVPLLLICWPWLIMSARNPVTKKWKFFIDKCLPFGVSIRCAIFQRISNALSHITKFKTGRKTIKNYLDDFLFVTYTRELCRMMTTHFSDICKQIGIPISKEKTVWPTNILVFLGILLDGIRMVLAIPEEKCCKAVYLLNKMLDKKKATVKELQALCGYLNFLNKAVYPGCVFTRRIYALICEGKTKLKPFHHVRLNAEF